MKFSIIGINYEVFGISAKQFIDKNGNGFYFNKKNSIYNLHKNKYEESQLTDISVSDEVPSVDFKLITDKSDNISLYDSQEYVYGFSIINDGFIDINNLKLNVYGYKKDNYKVSLEEIDLNQLVENELNEIKIEKLEGDNISYSNLEDGEQDKFSNICKKSMKEKKNKICFENNNKFNDIKNIVEECENSFNSNCNDKVKKENSLIPILPKSKKLFFTYFYLHLKKYKYIEFKLSLFSKIEIRKISSYFSIKKELISESIVNLKPLSITPIVSDPIIFENLLKLDEKVYLNYAKYICSNKYFVCFSFENLSVNKLNIYSCFTNTSNDLISQYKSMSFKGVSGDKETIIKKDVCEPNEIKNINLLINSDLSNQSFHFNDSCLKFSFIRWVNSVNNNIFGKIEVKQIFKDFNIQLNEVFKFKLEKTVFSDDSLMECTFKVKIDNLTKKQFSNLTLKLYLFKINIQDEENIIMNTSLNKQYLFNEEIESLIYEGQLTHFINFESNSSMTFSIKSFLFQNEEINFSCIILDDLCKLVYVCPIFINHKYI